MRVHGIRDIGLTEICDSRYDLGLFSSGYEPRCVWVPRMLGRGEVGTVRVLGFSNEVEDSIRRRNDAFFSERWGVVPLLASSDDDDSVYDVLGEVLGSGGADSARVLVDITSMSRMWYSGVVNWLRAHERFREVTVDFVYSVGTHRATPGAAVLRDFVALPGCEGEVPTARKSVLVLGLGFDGLLARAAVERLEPDVLVCAIADPGGHADYALRALDANSAVTRRAHSIIHAPLSSVVSMYRRLGEVVTAFRDQYDVALLPMGPKPHILAAVLVARRFDFAACLRVVGPRSGAERTETTGQIVACRVTFREEQGDACEWVTGGEQIGRVVVSDAPQAP